MTPPHRGVSSVALSGASEKLSDPRSHSGQRPWAGLDHRAKVKDQEHGAPGGAGAWGPQGFGRRVRTTSCGRVLAGREAGDAGNQQ